jgi:hypothetical protein
MEVYVTQVNCKDFEEMGLVMPSTVLKMTSCLKKVKNKKFSDEWKVLGDSEMSRNFILYCLILLCKYV